MTTFPPQKIIRFKASNYKMLTAVEIVPAPGADVVSLGGLNGSGKTSVLDGIEAVFRGADAFPEQPIRDGQTKAELEIEIDDLIIKRVISPKGHSLKIESKADSQIKYSSPQAMLDAFYGKVGFDPASFQRMKGDKQRTELQALLGLDFASINAENAAEYAKRTEVGRRLDLAKAAVANTPYHADAPAAETSIAELSTKLAAAQKTNRAKDAVIVRITEAKHNHSTAVADILQLENELEAARRGADKYEKEVAELKETLEFLPRADDAAIITQMGQVEATNAKVRSNVQRKAHLVAQETLTKAYDAHTAKLVALENSKTKALAEAKFPVKGLSFSDSGVLFNGKPFAQISTAEQIRVSVAMGMAMNPNLKVILIRDGSLLDSTTFAIIEAMAHKEGYQVWIEVVTDTPEEDARCSVVISEGAVKK